MRSAVAEEVEEEEASEAAVVADTGRGAVGVGTASYAAGVEGRVADSGARNRGPGGGGGAVRSSPPCLAPGAAVVGGSMVPVDSPVEAATAVEGEEAVGRRVEDRLLEQNGGRAPGRGYPAQHTPKCQRAPLGTGSHLLRSRSVPGSQPRKICEISSKNLEH